MSKGEGLLAISEEIIKQNIYHIRGENVMLDKDLAKLAWCCSGSSKAEAAILYEYYIKRFVYVAKIWNICDKNIW